MTARLLTVAQVAEQLAVSPAVNPEPGDILTVKEAAAFLKLGKTQLYDAIARGEVPHRRIGRSIRLSRAALVLWLHAPCNAPREGR